MNKCEIFIKPKNINMPDSDLILHCYEEYDCKYLTLFYNDGQKTFVDKNNENIVDFIEDLYADVNKNDSFIILFHDNIDAHYLDVNKQKYFYRTNKKICISQKDCNCLAEMLKMNKQKYNPFFQMFLYKNIYLQIDNNQINIYGKYYNYQSYLLSKEIKQIEKNYPIVPLSINQGIQTLNFIDNCYICGKKEIINGICVNHVIYLCADCRCQLRCQKCQKCNLYFSPRYMAKNNICIQCSMNTLLKTSDLFYENSIGLKYLQFIDKENVDFNKIQISDEKNKKLLQNKLFMDLLQLRNKSDDFVKKIDHLFYSKEMVRLFMFLHKPLLAL